MGGLCRLTLGCVHAVINITRCTDTRCSWGRLEHILNCTKMEFLGNFQGVLRAGTNGRAEIYTDTPKKKKKSPWGYGTGRNPWAGCSAMSCTSYNQQLVILGAITPIPVIQWVTSLRFPRVRSKIDFSFATASAAPSRASAPGGNCWSRNSKHS